MWSNNKENVLHQGYEGQNALNNKGNVLHHGYEGKKRSNPNKDVLHQSYEGHLYLRIACELNYQ